MVSIAQKLGLPRSFEIQNWSGRGRLNWATPMTLWKIFLFFEELQMILVSFFESFDGFWSTKILPSLLLLVVQILVISNLWRLGSQWIISLWLFHSVWKPKKKIKKLLMVEMLIFCTIMIYFNDLRFKKQNFPKICWDILWFIKGHPIKCKKS